MEKKSFKKEQQHHGELLKQFLDHPSRKILKKEFFRSFGFAKESYDWYNKPELKKRTIGMVYSFFKNDFDVTKYGYQKSDFGFIFSETKESISPVELFKGESIQVEEELISKYFKNLKDKISTTQDKLEICFYLARAKNESYEDSDIFRNGNSNYLKHIFQQFENSHIKYVRYLVLPLETEKDIASDKDKSIERALDIIFSETFNHIWDCFSKDENRFELYVCSKPRYLYSVGMIDKTYFVKEHDFYKDGVARPDMLLIYNLVQGDDIYITSMTAMYEKTLRDLREDGRNKRAPVWEVDKENFKGKADLIYARIVAEFEQKRNEKENIEKDLENNGLSPNEKLELITQVDEINSELTPLKKKKETWDRKMEAFKKIH